jgi:hypothetical protein
VNPAKLKALMALGASLVANHLRRVCSEVGAVVAMLERAFANVYCSFQGVRAFQTHFDLHDVYAVQAEGEKTWRVYESRADAPVNRVPPDEEWEKWLTKSRGKLLFEAHMKPGDVLYLPRGQYLPDARAEPELGERLAKLADRIRAVMTYKEFAIDVLNHQRHRARPPAAFELPAQRPPAWYSVARRAEVLHRHAGFAVAFEGGEIPVGATWPTIEWILKQRLFSVDDALARQPGADRDALAAGLDRLEQAGVIVRTEIR